MCIRDSSLGALVWSGYSLLFSALLAPLVYWAVKKIHSRFDEEEE